MWLVPEVDGFPVTSPRGEDQFGCAFNDGSKTFPVTSPRGEDLLPAPTTLAIIQVSSHPPPARGGSASALWGGYQTRCFQSPPREGRISPSAPPVPRPQDVSSHLPARGGSFGRRTRPTVPPRFQSPPREGRIRVKKYRVRADEAVSSHLPARGGSCRGAGRGPVQTGVSSHLPARGGSTLPGGIMRVVEFPVTSPRGEDRPRPACPYHYDGFQSPPREGRILSC